MLYKKITDQSVHRLPKGYNANTIWKYKAASRASKCCVLSGEIDEAVTLHGFLL